MEKYSIDGEINLMPYVMAVLRRWYWVILAAIIGAVIAGGLTMTRPRSYEAQASILFVGERTRLSLDPRLTVRDTTPSDSASRRMALLELATSEIIETQLPKEVVQQLASKNYRLGKLTRSITAYQMGDLVWIKAQASTPEKAQLLASAWALSYVSYINNEVFGSDIAAIAATEAQIEEAKATYEDAQQAYADYMGSNKLDQLSDRINGLFGLLQGNASSGLALHTQRINRAQELSLVLQDAQALRDQLEQGAAVAPGESLAAILLRVRAINPTLGQTSSALQLQVDQATASATTPAEVLEDVNRLIGTVEQQLRSLEESIEDSKDALAENAPLAQSTLTSEEQATYYAELLDLRREREQVLARGEMLLQARSIALEKLQVVERRLAEQQVSENQAGNEVRLASEAILPLFPASRGTMLRVIVGGMTGAIFGILLALVAALQLPLRLTRRTSLTPADAARPTASRQRG